ncbi:MAG: 23S rRNA (guanosine(2251)-2'-O)-methyltransferase RlmB [Bradymonadia bacterium]
MSSRQGLVPLPGIRPVEAMLNRAPHRLKKIQHVPDSSPARERLLDQAMTLGIKLERVPRKQLDEVSEVRHQGIVGFITPAGYTELDQLIFTDSPLIVALDQVTDPRNLGAILRSAEAFGATGALLPKHRSAHLGPTVARTSAGASEILPVAMETNLAQSIKVAQKAGLQCIGADMDGVHPEAIDWSRPTMLIMGAEGQGLRRLTRERCDQRVMIPLSGATASLNVSVAAGILLHTAAEHRKKG